MATESDNDRKPPAESFGAKLPTNTSIWYRLIIPGIDNEGTVDMITTDVRNIAQLRDEIKNKNRNRLNNVDAGELEVYPPGTKFDDNWNPKDGRTAYNPRKKVASLNFTSNKDDMEDDSEMEEDDTLIVVAPKVVYDSSHQVSFVFVVCIMLRVFCFSRLVLMVQYTLYFTFSMRLCSL